MIGFAGKGFDIQKIANNFKNWYISEPLGIGHYLANVICLADYTQNPHHASELIWRLSRRNSAANGALMRTAVVGLEKERDIEDAVNICKLKLYKIFKVMNVLRWFSAIICSIVIVLIGTPIINLVLNFLFSICGGEGKTGWGYMPPELATEFYSGLTFFNFVILPYCISLAISYGLAGFCSGKIIPRNNEKIAGWVCGIIMTMISALGCIYIWENEHWFFSILFVISFIINILIYIMTLIETNKTQTNNLRQQ